MQPIHKFLSHATIHVAMFFESWSFWHAEKVKLTEPVRIDLSDICKSALNQLKSDLDRSPYTVREPVKYH